MKPLLLGFTVFLVQFLSAQSLDYISVRKKNGQVVKNFYAGSSMILQQTNGSYTSGPVHSIRNDSVLITVYDIRYAPTSWGGYIKDTISTTISGIPYKDIQRIYLYKRQGFFQRNTGTLLMLAGGGYVLLNVLNGGFHGESITDSENLRSLGIATGIFATGFFLKKMFSTDGFSKKKHQIVYVDL